MLFDIAFVIEGVDNEINVNESPHIFTPGTVIHTSLSSLHHFHTYREEMRYICGYPLAFCGVHIGHTLL